MIPVATVLSAILRSLKASLAALIASSQYSCLSPEVVSNLLSIVRHSSNQCATTTPHTARDSFDDEEGCRGTVGSRKNTISGLLFSLEILSSSFHIIQLYIIIMSKSEYIQQFCHDLAPKLAYIQYNNPSLIITSSLKIKSDQRDT